MEKDKIIYFCLDKGKSAKKFPWSKIQFHYFNISAKEYDLGCCSIPEYYWNKKGWEEDKLAKVMEEKLKEEGAEEYYLHPSINKLLKKEENLPPKQLLQVLLIQNICWENLCIIIESKEQMQICQQMLEEYFPRVNRLIIVTDCQEGEEVYEELTDFVYEEYGIPSAVRANLDETMENRTGTVILDMKRQYRLPWKMIPSGAVYVDCYSENEKRYVLETKRKDVHYLSVVKNLDTIVKNGYNTLVN